MSTEETRSLLRILDNDLTLTMSGLAEQSGKPLLQVMIALGIGRIDSSISFVKDSIPAANVYCLSCMTLENQKKYAKACQEMSPADFVPLTQAVSKGWNHYISSSLGRVAL